jgi:hypothetical protein
LRERRARKFSAEIVALAGSAAVGESVQGRFTVIRSAAFFEAAKKADGALSRGGSPEHPRGSFLSSRSPKNKNEAEFCIGKKGRRLKFSSAEDESL